MKIGEAREMYSAQLHAYWEQKLSLAKQKKELEHRMHTNPNGKELFADEAATLELSYNTISEKYEEYHNFMEQIMEKHTALFNAEASKQQGEAMAEYAQDIVKIMEVARRIMKGAIVPATDEKKLMEYSMELYQAAKNISMLNELKEKEKYKSLWKDDENKGENPDPDEIANAAEIPVDAPALMDVTEVMASAGGGEMSE